MQNGSTAERSKRKIGAKKGIFCKTAPHCRRIRSKSEYIKSQRRNTSNQNSKYYQITKVFIAQSLLLSYSRNICTSAETKTIFGDVKANLAVTDTTLHEYINALVKL
ncbi:MAG: hypothetical protein II868_00815, partial [Butyrivibrio sp.]|nr:hypothetical protein [Butyrivibrio sp.]